MRDSIRLAIDGQLRSVCGGDTFTTLSRLLRSEGSVGTKVVCEEGDCGACTVLVGRLRDGTFEYRPVNSCILFVHQLDGAHVVTVEGLDRSGNLNAVQQAMVENHGAQCGFCTPGFVVAMTAMFESDETVDGQSVREALTGNLCRCTGYEPIIRAALSVDPKAQRKIGTTWADPTLAASLASTMDEPIRADSNGRIFFAPCTIEQAAIFRRDHLGSVIVQGATDLGVLANKRGLEPTAILSLAKIPGLDGIDEVDDAVEVGALVTLSALYEWMRDRIPQFHDILGLFGSPQIRNSGTLAGNIANASPIADTIPFLFVVDAEVELTGVHGARRVNINNLYRGYKQLAVEPDEIITRVRIPIPSESEHLRLYKVSRRRDLDISTFTAAIRIRRSDGQIDDARVAFGGVAPTVIRLPRTEEFLTGSKWEQPVFETAGGIAASEISPISDVRGSKEYRTLLAHNLLVKFWWDVGG